MRAPTQLGQARRRRLERAAWLLAASGSLALGCWTTRPATSRGATDGARDGEREAAPEATQATDDTAGAPQAATSQAGTPIGEPSPASAPGSATPPDRAQVARLLAALLESPEPSRRIQVLLVDDEECFAALLGDAPTLKALPDGVRVEAGRADSVTSDEPSEAGFGRLRAALASVALPTGRKLIHTRLYGEQTQIGWIALCAVEQPFLGEDDLLRQKDATSLTFGLTAAAEERVRAHEPTTARLAFTVDGNVVLALAPLDALRLQQEPEFTLFQQ